MSEAATMVDIDTLPRDEGQPFYPCPRREIDFMETAAFRNVTSVELPISPDEVFDVLEDPESWPKWALGIREVRWTSPKPYGPGTTRTVRFASGILFHEEFPIFDRPREFSFRFYATNVSSMEAMAFAEHYVVDDLGDGHSRLTWTVALDPAGALAWFPFAPMARAGFRVYMMMLRRYVRKKYGK